MIFFKARRCLQKEQEVSCLILIRESNIISNHNNEYNVTTYNALLIRSDTMLIQ